MKAVRRARSPAVVTTGIETGDADEMATAVAVTGIATVTGIVAPARSKPTTDAMNARVGVHRNPAPLRNRSTTRPR